MFFSRCAVFSTFLLMVLKATGWTAPMTWFTVFMPLMLAFFVMLVLVLLALAGFKAAKYLA